MKSLYFETDLHNSISGKPIEYTITRVNGDKFVIYVWAPNNAQGHLTSELKLVDPSIPTKRQDCKFDTIEEAKEVCQKHYELFMKND